ncbi:TetR family transcriptional regulator C-terminal domain-containing protein [Alkalihalobacillus sp. 1P02AB]|uniref:TetR/AcrR family transcriptional regulator n=1 Tax=Alkalihalobacillus sp. 1P02AB TaxID=3132260 RepID=UPI0039A51CE2
MKEKILEVAKELFIQRGYNATSMGDIVKLSNSSKGTLYYHFTNKEALFLEVLNLEEGKWFAKWHVEEKKCQTNLEKFYKFAEFTATVDVHYPLRMAIAEFYSMQHESELINEKINELDQRYILYYRNMFEAGNETNEWNIEDLDTLSELAAATFGGLDIFTQHLDLKKRAKMFDRFANLFLKGAS